MAKQPKPPCPKCPACNSSKQVTAVGTVGDQFHCGRCGGLFDNDPDEGGSYHDRFVDARLNAEDARRQAQQRRFGRR